MFQCITVAKVKEDHIPAIAEAGRILAEITRRERGNLSYRILRAVEAPDTLIFVEEWETPEDFQAHVAGADTEGTPLNTFGKTMDPAAAAPPQIYPAAGLV